MRDAKENAAAAGVSDRVTFVQGDLFEADFRDATVVTMYLSPAVNMRPRPKLLSELRPGTRIVSHDFDMGDWQPRRKVTIKVGATDHDVFFWVVPPRAARTDR